jgi:nucleoside-diphosphate-sugar epimerase
LRVLVTGGAGGLGASVCALLIQKGHEVHVFDLENNRNLETIRKLPDGIEVCWGDITDVETISSCIVQTDIVVHMAAILPPLALNKPELAKRINVSGTKNLIEAIKQKGSKIPIVYTSSVSVFGPTPDANEPLSIERTQPNPVDSYSETKFQAENIIKWSGLDYLILRLTSTPYLTANFKGMKQMFDIPLNNRVEFCHPGNVALAIGNAVHDFASVKGKTLIISGGSGQRMLYIEMIGGILKTFGLPLPPEDKFTEEPYYLDWYDTRESENLLHYQKYTYNDYLDDFSEQLSKQYGKLLLPLMRYFIGPVFGKIVTRLM